MEVKVRIQVGVARWQTHDIQVPNSLLIGYQDPDRTIGDRVSEYLYQHFREKLNHNTMDSAPIQFRLVSY